jgi:RNA-directed DNA polymerase
LFDADSYAYRPGKSALQAVGQARKRCWRYDWVLDLDIKGFFDNIDHDLMMRAVKKHAIEKWIVVYVERTSGSVEGVMGNRDSYSDRFRV